MPFAKIAYSRCKSLHLQKNHLDWSDILVCDDKDTDEESLSHTQETEFVAGETDVLLGFSKICLSHRYLLREKECKDVMKFTDISRLLVTIS